MGACWQNIPAALCCLWATAAASAPHEIELIGRDVTVADLAVVPTRDARIEGLVVARVPDGRATLALSPARQKVLLRRRVPGRALALRYDAETIFRARSDIAAREAGSDCVALQTPLASGEYLDRAMVSVTPCRPDQAAPALSFDRRVRASRATAPIAAGSYLGRVFVAPGEVAGTDRTYDLLFRSGPVAVERKVALVQPARVGHAALVRTEDGAVVRAQLAGGDTARKSR